jgi:hypothetical protein
MNPRSQWPSSEARQVNTAFMVLFVFLWCGFLLWVDAFMVSNWVNAGASQKYAATQGSVISSHVSTSHTAEGASIPHPSVKYRYTVRGVEYTGDRIGYATQDVSLSEAVVARYPVGSHPTVYYDPADPVQSTLEKGSIPVQNAVTTFFFLVPFHLGGVLLVWWLVVSQRSANPSRTPEVAPAEPFFPGEENASDSGRGCSPLMDEPPR